MYKRLFLVVASSIILSTCLSQAIDTIPKASPLAKVLKDNPVLPDTIHLFFRLGTNFDFLNDNLSFNKVYGELRYYNDNLIILSRPKKKNWFGLGFDVGGFRSTSLSIRDTNYIDRKNFIDPVNPLSKPDSFRVIGHTISSKVSESFGQLSLFFNPFAIYNVSTGSPSDRNYANLRLGLGLYSEMYRRSSYVNYYDTSVIQKDTSYIARNTRFVSNNFRDSIGTTNTNGYFGISVLAALYTKSAVVKIRAVIGKLVQGDVFRGSNYNPPTRSTIKTSNTFYLIDGTIIEPHSKISVQANIRGLLPNYTPITTIYATKAFDLQKLFDVLTK